ncbi:MAG: Holliday junction branch migration protein RuvA [Methylococcaceae bacterium]
MIGFLRGKLISKTPPALLVDVQGVGYEVEAPMTTFYELPALGEPVTLYTHLVIREDAHSLFGFINEADRLLFRTLIKVNGVGPKLALAILSGQSATEFAQAIHQGDINTLIRLPGVGKKTAERLLIELRDKLPALPESNPINAPVSITHNNAIQEAISALCALGYKATDASKMVQAIPAEGKSCEQLIRLALQSTLR